MARVLSMATATSLSLPGRASHEIVSSVFGSRAVTLRRVEIPVPKPGDAPRGRHYHTDFEECIYVLAGQGATHCDSGALVVKEGDVILVPPGEPHATENTGDVPLVLLCFFPVNDIRAKTRDATAGVIGSEPTPR
jgi:mannose-6-phosphate isomerase-like protein (cupin superfamily)